MATEHISGYAVTRIILWSQIPCIIVVQGTFKETSNGIGNYSGPYRRSLQVAPGKFIGYRGPMRGHPGTGLCVYVCLGVRKYKSVILVYV